MPMPSDIGIIDCMISFPASDFSQYDFIRKQLKDSQSSEEFDFPVEYMFKNVPKELHGAREPDRHHPSRDGPLRDREGLDRM